MKKKIKLLLLCVPLYLIHLIGEWYYINTSVSSRKFNFKKESRTYWKEVSDFMKK